MNKIRAAVASAAAALLARESNEETTAESLAEELAEAVTETVVEAYENIQAKSYNLVVVAHFQTPDGKSHATAVGPLSTRAAQRARDVGARFAWDYKTRTGTGKYVLVPLIRDPNEAWDEARASQVAQIIEVTRPSLSLDPFGPVCICGLPEHPRYNSLGDAAELICPLHPTKENDGPGAGS